MLNMARRIFRSVRISVRVIFLSALVVCSSFREAHSQAVYLPTSHEVYPFLKRMEARRLLGAYRDAAKPLSRLDLARNLKLLESETERMTSVERETYEYLKGEFHYELSALSGDKEPSEIRWHLFSTDLPRGIMKLDVNGAYAASALGERSLRHRSQGFQWYGSVYGNVGFFLNFVDHREVGSGFNPFRLYTPEPGVVLTNLDHELIEYNTAEAQVSYQTGAFQFSLEKMQNSWGAGRHGNVIFSNRTPSYPQIKMRVPVTDWMDFIYVHASLRSNLIDSSRSYDPGSSTLKEYFRPVERQKFMAAHQLEMTILNGFDLSLGESVVYSDRGVDLLYLIPVMFFKSGEHYNGDRDNIQWFLSTDINLVRNVNLYGSLFIDDLNINNILDATKSINEIAYTVGFQVYDLPLKNLEATFEYSRLNPWVYHHKFPATDFSSNGFDLGHWVGQNGDDLWIDISYRPSHALVLGATYEIYRKGGFADVAYHYEKELPAPPFLFGPLHEEQTYGFYGRYQIVRDGFVDACVMRRKIEDETTGSSRQWEFTLGVQYGIW